jgi:hypothetical protein
MTKLFIIVIILFNVLSLIWGFEWNLEREMNLGNTYIQFYNIVDDLGEIRELQICIPKNPPSEIEIVWYFHGTNTLNMYDDIMSCNLQRVSNKYKCIVVALHLAENRLTWNKDNNDIHDFQCVHKISKQILPQIEEQLGIKLMLKRMSAIGFCAGGGMVYRMTSIKYLDEIFKMWVIHEKAITYPIRKIHSLRFLLIGGSKDWVSPIEEMDASFALLIQLGYSCIYEKLPIYHRFDLRDNLLFSTIGNYLFGNLNKIIDLNWHCNETVEKTVQIIIFTKYNIRDNKDTLKIYINNEIIYSGKNNTFNLDTQLFPNGYYQIRFELLNRHGKKISEKILENIRIFN